MRAPIAFTYGNCVFAEGPGDAWAGFAVDLGSYAWLTEDAKRGRFLSLLAGLEAVEADIQLLRVTGEWDVRQYQRQVARAAGHQPENDGHAAARDRYEQAQVARLRSLEAGRPALFVFVSLREPERDVSSYVSTAASSGPREWLRAIRRLSIADRRLLSVPQLERLRVRAD